jgi:hypothetical protein
MPNWGQFNEIINQAGKALTTVVEGVINAVNEQHSQDKTRTNTREHYKPRDWARRYEEHIHSRYWYDEVRPAVISRSRGYCERCGAEIGKRGDCHHLSYDAFGRELEALHTVVYYCRPCHDVVHSKCVRDPKPFSWSDILSSIKVEIIDPKPSSRRRSRRRERRH